MMKQVHKHSASQSGSNSGSVSISISESLGNTGNNTRETTVDRDNGNDSSPDRNMISRIRKGRYLTRAQKRKMEEYELRQIEKKKKKYKKSLMSIGGHKRRRNYLDGNLVCFNKDEV